MLAADRRQHHLRTHKSAAGMPLLTKEADVSKYYYQLTFDITFSGDGGKAYIAMCPPYSYSKLMQ